MSGDSEIVETLGRGQKVENTFTIRGREGEWCQIRNPELDRIEAWPQLWFRQ
jgi:hypothetical protein